VNLFFWRSANRRGDFPFPLVRLFSFPPTSRFATLPSQKHGLNFFFPPFLLFFWMPVSSPPENIGTRVPFLSYCDGSKLAVFSPSKSFLVPPFFPKLYPPFPFPNIPIQQPAAAACRSGPHPSLSPRSRFSVLTGKLLPTFLFFPLITRTFSPHVAGAFIVPHLKVTGRAAEICLFFI